MTDAATFSVPEITCNHCVQAITKEVSMVPGVESLHVDLDQKVVTVTGGEREAIVEAIDEAGFDVEQ